ncbi:MAG: ferredoxin-NADP reductase [Anaerolinea sp. 4484_236]|nr:MAG: ferredoxin-NADP reductase [Anaerolinea sp. 4484_236]RLD07292.1 MAG: sulfide/dihydroorotate dehydrogenase-like FAD/NAD-binding protein [Chloroflexota bacterium]
MHKIISKKKLAPKIIRFTVEAPEIASSRKPGQFIVLREGEKSERLPFTIVDSDSEAGTIDLIIQEAGYSTLSLCALEEGDFITDILGPLGKPTDIKNYGTVVCVGGGVGTAVIYPIVKGMREAGNHVITLNGARNKELIILEEELKEVSDELIISTDDGSYGVAGFGSTILQGILEEGRKIDCVVAIGPVMMMRAVAEVTRPYEIETIVSLNAIMIDGTGMCGGCRVTVGGEVKFACVDGPEFDAHLVDFEELITRAGYYRKEEQCQMKKLADQLEQEKA